MSKKPAKRPTKKPEPSAAEIAVRVNRDRLRRLQTAHRTLKALARNVARYAREWEVDRAATARALLEGSAYGVFERDLVQRLQVHGDHQERISDELRREVEQLTTAREKAGV